MTYTYTAKLSTLKYVDNISTAAFKTYYTTYSEEFRNDQKHSIEPITIMQPISLHHKQVLNVVYSYVE